MRLLDPQVFARFFPYLSPLSMFAPGRFTVSLLLFTVPVFCKHQGCGHAHEWIVTIIVLRDVPRVDAELLRDTFVSQER